MSDRLENDDIADAEQETVTSASAAFQLVATGYLLHRSRQTSQDPGQGTEREAEPEPEPAPPRTAEPPGPENTARPEPAPAPTPAPERRGLWQRIREAWQVIRGKGTVEADRPDPAPAAAGPASPTESPTPPAAAAAGAEAAQAAAAAPDADQLLAASHAADRELYAPGISAVEVNGLSEVDLRSVWDAAQKWTTIDPDANAAARHVAQFSLETGQEIGIDTAELERHAAGEVEVNPDAVAALAEMTGREPQITNDSWLQGESEALRENWEASRESEAAQATETETAQDAETAQTQATEPVQAAEAGPQPGGEASETDRYREALAEAYPDHIDRIERSKYWQNGELPERLGQIEAQGGDVGAWLADKNLNLDDVRTPGAYLHKVAGDDLARTSGAAAPEGQAPKGEAPQAKGAGRPVTAKISEGKRQAAQTPRTPAKAKTPAPGPERPKIAVK